jgi:hypothetical protein
MLVLFHAYIEMHDQQNIKSLRRFYAQLIPEDGGTTTLRNVGNC